MKRILIAAVLLLAACTSEAEKAERQLAMVESGRPTRREICEARKKVTAAYLAEGDNQKFQTAKSYENVYCHLAELDPLGDPKR